MGNKCDLESERQVQFSEGQELAKKWGCTFYETSAKTKMNNIVRDMNLIFKLTQLIGPLSFVLPCILVLYQHVYTFRFHSSFAPLQVCFFELVRAVRASRKPASKVSRKPRCTIL